MTRFIFLTLITWCAWPLELNSQHYGAWRLAYGDSASLNEDLPALMNPLPFQNGYQAERAPILFLTGSRLYRDSYDHCNWTSKNKLSIRLHDWWDIMGVYPEARYVFDDSGRFVEYGYYGQQFGNPNDLDIKRREIHRYDVSGRLEYDEHIRYKAHIDSFSTVSQTFLYRPDGKLITELIRFTEEPSGGTDRMDSVQYSYNSAKNPEEKVTFSGPLSGILLPSKRTLYSYDSLNRLSQTSEQEWLADRHGWQTNKQVDYEHDGDGRVALKTVVTSVDGDGALFKRFRYRYSADGLETIQTGYTLIGSSWVEDYYFREVVNARGQPEILDEFHRNEAGGLYLNRMGKYNGFGRTNGDLRGKNRFTYDDDGLIILYLNYFSMDQAENLPDIKREFIWKKTSHVPKDVPGEPEIRVYPNPCTDRLIAEIGQNPGMPASLEILKLTGRMYQKIRQIPDENRLEVSLADLAPGFYLARITIGDKIVVRKFIRMVE